MLNGEEDRQVRVNPAEIAKLRAEEQAVYDAWRKREEEKEQAALDAAQSSRVEERNLRATLLALAQKAFPLYPIENRMLESDRVIRGAPGARPYFRFLLSLEAAPRDFPADVFAWFYGAVVYVTVPEEEGDDRRVVYTNATRLSARKKHPGWVGGVDPDPERSARMAL